MSRFGSSSIRDFSKAKSLNDIDDELKAQNRRNSSGRDFIMAKHKRTSTDSPLGPNKRRKLSPSPDALPRVSNPIANHGVNKAQSPISRQQVNVVQLSGSSSQHSPSEPSSSPEVLTFDGSNEGPPQENPLPQATPAQRSESPTKTSASRIPTSSLTTLPRSTQSSGSRRTVKNGEEIVMDSQSGEDSDELVDPVVLLGPRRVTATLLSASPPPRKMSNACSGFSSRGSGELRLSTRGSTASPAIPKPPEKKYKFSLNSLVKNSEKAAQAQTKVQEHADKLEQQEQEWVKEDEIKALNENHLASVVEHGSDEEGKAKRVVQAISRTEVMEQILAWHFFDNEAAVNSRKPFPFAALPDQGWMVVLKDPNQRTRLFIAGFATRMTHCGKLLPAEVLDWLLSELCHEESEELLYAYVEVVTASAQVLRDSLTASKIQKLFETLGASREAVESHVSIHPEPTKSNARYWIPAQLRYLIRCLQGFSRWISQETRFYVLHVLVRLFLDENIRHDGEYQILISETLAILIRDIPEDEADNTLNVIGQMLYETVPSQVMRERLVSSLPRHTPRTHLFRRRLAFAFALETPKHIEKPMTSPKLTDHVLLHLAKGSLFRISPNTDYKVLTARFNMLDVAIDAGFSDFSWLRLDQDASKEEAEKQKEKEKKFNAGIDMLAQEILEIMARIVDSGMSSLRRTEAKAAAQRLQQRLECAVRTKEKPAKDWFGVKDDVVRREFMEKWFEKPAEGDVDEDSFVQSEDAEEQPVES